MAITLPGGVGSTLASVGVSIPTSPLDVLTQVGIQRDFNFEVRLPDIKGIPGILLAPYCQSLDFGQYNFSELTKIRWGAFKRGYAGVMDIPPLRMTFIQAIPDLVSAYFTAWRSLIVSSKGYYAPKNAYSKSAYIALFDRSSLPVSLYRLSGVFPKSYPAHRLSNEGRGVKLLDVELNVDDFKDMLNLA